jgi:hypothetical protein
MNTGKSPYDPFNKIGPGLKKEKEKLVHLN